MRLPLGAALAALLAGCSSGSVPEGDGQKARVEAADQVSAANTSSAALPAPAAATTRSTVTASAKSARRCGWLSNPTPANWWLTDADGEWILATQGGDQAPGMDEMPDMSTAGWVETNGHHGYGCACMTITADSDRRVTLIADAQPRPLEQCRADASLPKPE